MADKTLRAVLELIKKGDGDKEYIAALKNIVKEQGKASTSGDKLTNSTKGVDAIFKKIVSAGMLAKAGALLLDFGKASIEAASSAQEMQSKFDTVFGSSAIKVEEALSEMGDSMNRSTLDLQAMASSVQDLFVPMGIARDEAADMSVSLTALAVDVASFNNAADDQVMLDFQRALIGGGATVAKYGIVMTEASVKQKAFALGLASTNEPLTENAKLQARLAILYEDTTDAQGDAIRTADSYENTMKDLAASLQELQVSIGNELLPTMTKMASETTKAIDKSLFMNEVVKAGEAAVAAGTITQKEFAAVLRQVSLDGLRAAQAMEIFTGSTEDTTKAAEEFAMSQDDAAAATAAAAKAAEFARLASFGLTGQTIDLSDAATQAAMAEEALEEGLKNVARAFSKTGDGSEDFAERTERLMGIQEELRASAISAATAVKSIFDVGDAGNAADALKDLNRTLAGGQELDDVYENVIDRIEAGLDPEPARRALEKIGAEAIDLAISLNEISFEEGAERFEEEFGRTLEDAHLTLNGIVDGMEEVNSLTAGTFGSDLAETLEEPFDLMNSIFTQAQAIKNVNATWRINVDYGAPDVSGLTGSGAAAAIDQFIDGGGGNNDGGNDTTQGPFAVGGEFRVPGTGGVDSQLVQFRATPGERVTVGDGGPMGGRGGGGVTIQNLNINTAATNADQIAREIMPAIQRETNRQIKAGLRFGGNR